MKNMKYGLVTAAILMSYVSIIVIAETEGIFGIIAYIIVAIPLFFVGGLYFEAWPNILGMIGIFVFYSMIGSFITFLVRKYGKNT